MFYFCRLHYFDYVKISTHIIRIYRFHLTFYTHYEMRNNNVEILCFHN